MFIENFIMDGQIFSILQLIVEDDEEDESYILNVVLPEFLIDEERHNKVKKRRIVISRDRQEGYRRIFSDYLAHRPKYPEVMFRRRFRMSSTLFRKLLSELQAADPYFVEREDAIGQKGISALQKMVAALRMLSYGECADRQDEYLQLSESTAREAFKKFCEVINYRFGKKYLRKPTVDDVKMLLHVNEMRGFPGMAGKYDSIISLS